MRTDALELEIDGSELWVRVGYFDCSLSRVMRYFGAEPYEIDRGWCFTVDSPALFEVVMAILAQLWGVQVAYHALFCALSGARLSQDVYSVA